MKRTTIFVREDLEGDLRAIALRRHVTVAKVVREALDDYVARSKKRPAARPGFIAVGASGRSDVAERHEELLWKSLEPHCDAMPAKDEPSRSRRTPKGRRRRAS